MKHFHCTSTVSAPAELKVCWGANARKEFTQAVARIAPHVRAVGRLERALVAWRKFMAGKYSLRAAICISRDYAKEFAEFRRQAAAAKLQTA